MRGKAVTDVRATLRGAVWLLLALLAALALPGAADACAVCFGDGSDDWTAGFVLGTILMLALPPAIVLGAGFAIWRSIKRHEAHEAEAEARDGAAAPTRS